MLITLQLAVAQLDRHVLSSVAPVNFDADVNFRLVAKKLQSASNKHAAVAKRIRAHSGDALLKCHHPQGNFLMQALIVSCSKSLSGRY